MINDVEFAGSLPAGRPPLATYVMGRESNAENGVIGTNVLPAVDACAAGMPNPTPNVTIAALTVADTATSLAINVPPNCMTPPDYTPYGMEVIPGCPPFPD
ncbi:unannotated protein [freshwater metagenome]|uniref:Unannotated protein n=1 Tax=freshwater metagenome TaxID=449393 RepID=A0A6J6RBB8_9ZZZZ